MCDSLARVFLLSHKKALMDGDESVETAKEYEKWEALLGAHPDYQAERLAELQDFLDKHAARNAAALDATRRFLPPNVKP